MVLQWHRLVQHKKQGWVWQKEGADPQGGWETQKHGNDIARQLSRGSKDPNYISKVVFMFGAQHTWGLLLHKSIKDDNRLVLAYFMKLIQGKELHEEPAAQETIPMQTPVHLISLLSTRRHHFLSSS